MATQETNMIAQALTDLNSKLDNLISMLPQTYVNIRTHEIQIKAHDEKISEVLARVGTLEQWRADSTQWANEAHQEIRHEQKEDIKGLTASVNKVETNLSILTEKVTTLIKILLWVLGLIATITIGLIVAYLTHRF